MCNTCYNRHRAHGSLDQYPPWRPVVIAMPGDIDVAVAEYDFLVGWGLSVAQVAQRCGVKPDSLESALRRRKGKVGAQ